MRQMLIGEKIRVAREMGELSARGLDRLAHLREGTTWKVESSKTGNVETKTLAVLARVLGLNLEYLVNDVGPKPTVARVREAVARARVELERGAGKGKPPGKPTRAA
jgi:hypothetical protein